MKIVVHDNLLNAKTMDVTRVVVYDDMDNPIGYALEYAPGAILADVLREGHELEFARVLHEMGINKVVHVQSVQPRRLDQIQFRD